MERWEFNFFTFICLGFILTCECMLTQCPTGLQCAGSTVVFTCVREGTSLLWRVSLQSNPSVSSMPPVIFFSDSTVNQATTQTLTFNGQQYTATLLERSPLLNSSLTVTAVAAMDLIVQCSDDQLDVLMLPLNVSKVTGPPPGPVNLVYDVTKQDNETVCVLLTWGKPVTNDSNEVEDYTVTLISSQNSEVTSSDTSISLNFFYNTNYTIQVKANNCIGSSINTTLGPFLFVDCLPPPVASGVVFEPYSNTTEGASILYSCNGQNRSVIQCMSNGKWSPDPSTMTCDIVMCEPPQHPMNGSIVHFNGTLEHSQAVFQCSDGLFPPDQRVARCIRDITTGRGVWSPNPMDLVCRLDPFNCSTPAPPKNGYIDMMLSIDQIIYYGCNEGYAPIDVRRAVCVDQDTWSSLPQQLNCTNNMQPNSTSSPTVPVAIAVVLMIVILIIVATVTIIVVIKMRSKGFKDEDNPQFDLELRDTNETPAEYCTTKHPGPRGNQTLTVNTDTLVYAGLDLPSKQSSSYADHADNPTSYADINFTAMSKPLKEPCYMESPDDLLNLDSLIIQLKPEVTSKWEEFAKVVGLSQEVIKDLSSCGPSERMVEMLDYWLRHHPSKPTWREVAQILEKIHFYQLADDILKVYKTGELPVPFDMNEIPEGTLPRSEPPPPLPPKIADFDDNGPDAPPLASDFPPKPPPHRDTKGLCVRAPPPLPPYHENSRSVLPPNIPPKSYNREHFAAVPALPPKPRT